MPSVLHLCSQRLLRKFLHEFLVAIREAFLLELRQAVRSFLAEVTHRRSRICVSFSVQETPNIPPVFFEESLCLVFGMPLKMDDKALPFLLCKAVNARYCVLG